MGDEEVAFEEKAKVLDVVIENKSSDKLDILLTYMGLSSLVKLVLKDSSRLPVIKNGVKEKAVLDVLKKHGYINDYAVDSKANEIRVKRKK